MDCITNSPWAMNVFHLEEVADWVYVTAESWGTMYWTASLDWTSSLTDAQREIVYQAAKEAAQYTRQEIRDTCELIGTPALPPASRSSIRMRRASPS